MRSQHALAKKASQIMKNGQDATIQMKSDTRCFRVNIPCHIHDNRLCQLDVKMTNDLHGTNKI